MNVLVASEQRVGEAVSRSHRQANDPVSGPGPTRLVARSSRRTDRRGTATSSPRSDPQRRGELWKTDHLDQGAHADRLAWCARIALWCLHPFARQATTSRGPVACLPRPDREALVEFDRGSVGVRASVQRSITQARRFWKSSGTEVTRTLRDRRTFDVLKLLGQQSRPLSYALRL